MDYLADLVTIQTNKIWAWQTPFLGRNEKLDVKRDGRNILLWKRPPGAYGLAVHKLARAGRTRGDQVIDVTSIVENVFKKPCADWLWNECFNSWAVMAWFKHDGCLFYINFDAESDADKFWEWIDETPKQTVSRFNYFWRRWFN
jgi:hypothetical protein